MARESMAACCWRLELQPFHNTGNDVIVIVIVIFHVKTVNYYIAQKCVWWLGRPSCWTKVKRNSKSLRKLSCMKYVKYYAYSWQGAYAPYARCMADLLVYDYRCVVYGCADRDIWSNQVSCRFERYKNWGSQSTSWLRKCRVKKTSTTTSFFTKVRRLSLCLIHHENVLNSGCRSTKYEKERRDFSHPPPSFFYLLFLPLHSCPLVLSPASSPFFSLPCYEAAPFNRARESRERSKIFQWSSAKTILVYWSPGKASGNRDSVLLVPLFFSINLPFWTL